MRNEPVLMRARWPGVCPETGYDIQPGDVIAWYPGARRAYHARSVAAQMISTRQDADKGKCNEH